jgi:hypothetical protein
MDQWVYLSSQDSASLYRDNHGGNFTIQLPKVLQGNGDWEVALTEIKLPPLGPRIKTIEVCTDICEHTIVGDELHPILRRIALLSPEKESFHSFHTNIYRKGTGTNVHQIKIYLVDSQGNGIRLRKGYAYAVECTLHFRQTPLRLCL